MTSQIAEWFSEADPDAADESAGTYPIFRNSLAQMLSAPLEGYLDQARKVQNFVAPSPILRRGYLGTWEVVGDKLYLIGLRGNNSKGEPVYSSLALESLFTDKAERVSQYQEIQLARESPLNESGLWARSGVVEKTRVFADWYSGTLCLPSGKLLADACSGFLRVYETHRLIDIDCGRVVRESVQRNNHGDLLNPRTLYALGHIDVRDQEKTNSRKHIAESIHGSDPLSKLRRRGNLINEAKRAGLWLDPLELEVLSLIGIESSDTTQGYDEDRALLKPHDLSSSSSSNGIRFTTEFTAPLSRQDQRNEKRSTIVAESPTTHPTIKSPSKELTLADKRVTAQDGKHQFLKRLCPFCRGLILQEARTCIECGVGFPKSYEGETPGSNWSTAPRILSDEEPNSDSWENAYKRLFDK